MWLSKQQYLRVQKRKEIEYKDKTKDKREQWSFLSPAPTSHLTYYSKQMFCWHFFLKVLKNILYILLLVRLHFDRSGDPPHHPLHSWIFSFDGSSGNGTKIVQPINISEWIQGRLRNSFSGDIQAFSYAPGHEQLAGAISNSVPRNSQGTVYVTEEKHGKEQIFR